MLVWLTGAANVVPVLQKCAPSEKNLRARLTEVIRKEGGTSSAQAICRSILAKDDCAKLRMPSLRKIEEQQNATAFVSVTHNLERLTERAKAGAAAPIDAVAILAVIFGHADLASRCATGLGEEEATPLCVSPAAMGSLIALGDFTSNQENLRSHFRF